MNDVELFRALNGFGGASLDPVAAGVSQLGAVLIGAITIALALRSERARGRPLVVAAIASAIGACVACLALKELVSAPRPGDLVPNARIVDLFGASARHASSFPSGHAALAFALAVPVAVLRPRAAPILLAIALAVGLSRVYVGAHFPSDVAAGCLLGIASGVIAAVRFGRPAAEREPVAPQT